MELGETPGAFSGLAIGLTGVFTVLLAPLAASLPL
ncbi:MAG: LrgB family protein [Thermoguttaceae bacterium]